MLGPSPALRGGIAAVAASLLDGGLQARYINTYAQGGAVAKAAAFARALGELLSALCRGQVALVHAHVASRGSFMRKSLLLLLARSFGVPTIFHLHGGGFSEFAQGRLWVRHTLERSDRVVVLSGQWRDWVAGFAPRARVQVMANPVSVPGEARATRSGDAGVVLYLGLIAPGKGVYELLRAWATFRTEHPRWRLCVAGNGEVDSWLDESTRLGVRGDIDFLGWVAADAKAAALDRADMLVLPSYREGMPVVLLEAMARGIPVVSTPVGGTPDILNDGVEGLMVPPRDDAALAVALARLADDAALRERLGAAGRARVLHDNEVGTIVRRWQALYAELAP